MYAMGYFLFCVAINLFPLCVSVCVDHNVVRRVTQEDAKKLKVILKKMVSKWEVNGDVGWGSQLHGTNVLWLHLVVYDYKV